MLIQHIQKITLAARLILLSPVLIISLAFARASAAEDNYLAEEALISALRDGGLIFIFATRRQTGHKAIMFKNITTG